jgi:hypothetical protein
MTAMSMTSRILSPNPNRGPVVTKRSQPAGTARWQNRHAAAPAWMGSAQQGQLRMIKIVTTTR